MILKNNPAPKQPFTINLSYCHNSYFVANNIDIIERLCTLYNNIMYANNCSILDWIAESYMKSTHITHFRPIPTENNRDSKVPL